MYLLGICHTEFFSCFLSGLATASHLDLS